MKKENSISFNTNRKCRLCDAGNIFLKFDHSKVAFGAVYLVAGGSSSTETFTDTNLVYFCGKCGVVFMPTKTNNLLPEKISDYEKIAEKLFKETDPMFLNCDLLNNEVFEEVKTPVNDPEGTLSSRNDLSYILLKNHELPFLFQGSSVRVPKLSSYPISFSNNILFPEFDGAVQEYIENPYIISDGSNSKLVWWAKKIRKENRPNFVDNEPLPESSMLATFIIAIDYSNNVRKFFVPAHVIE